MNISSQISRLEAQIRQLQATINDKNNKIYILQRIVEKTQEKIHINSLPSKITREAYDKYFIDSSNMYLITITFDPELLKTLQLDSTDKQANYIHSNIVRFHQNLNNSMSAENLIYGCLEFHKSGILHSHFLIKFIGHDGLTFKADYSTFIDSIFNDLKMKFTANPYNKVCIDYQPVKKFYEACDYIEKEPYLLFKLGHYSTSVLDD